MAKIDYTKPVTLEEINKYLQQAQFGYEVPDGRLYARHVGWLLQERERLEAQARLKIVDTGRLEPLPLPDVADDEEGE